MRREVLMSENGGVEFEEGTPELVEEWFEADDREFPSLQGDAMNDLDRVEHCRDALGRWNAPERWKVL